MASSKRQVDCRNNILMRVWWQVKMIFEVKEGVFKVPIGWFRMGEQ